MTNSIKALRSTFNLMLSIVELIIGLSFAIRIFSSDITSSGSLSDFVSETFGKINSNTSSSFGNLQLTGPLTFLVFILGFMLFSAALFSQVPRILQQSKKDLEMEMD